MKRCLRKSKLFPNSCLILLNPSFMPRLYVMEKLTCLKHAPMSQEFIGEYHPFDPWVYPISSHTSNDSPKVKKEEEMISTKSLAFHLMLFLWSTVFPSRISPYHPHVFLLLCHTTVNCSFLPALSSAVDACFLSQLFPSPFGLFPQRKA